jgi:hypothetical protein
MGQIAGYVAMFLPSFIKSGVQDGIYAGESPSFSKALPRLNIINTRTDTLRPYR